MSILVAVIDHILSIGEFYLASSVEYIFVEFLYFHSKKFSN